jgi:hypothetical protein
MTFDLLTPWPDDDAASLTGRIAATLLDRSLALREEYPQAAPDAPWWPPYHTPASPTATARENLERYRASMAEAVTQARARMARMAQEHDLEQRIAHARERARSVAEDLAERSRTRAEDLAERSRTRAEDLAEEARLRFDDLREQARDRASEILDRRRPEDPDDG